MVLGAVVIRDRLDDDDSGSGARSGALALVCATELRAVCDAIDADEGDVDVTIEPAAMTADRLQSVDPEGAKIDGWLAPGPWGEIVDSARAPSAGDLFATPGQPLARSPFVVVVWKDKRALLACADPVDLGCLGEAVIKRGFRLGTAPDSQAEGVLADAALGAGHIKNPDFATNDLNESDLSDWIASVDTNVDRVTRSPGGRSVTELLTFGPAGADGFLATKAVADAQLAGAANRTQLDQVATVPTATADVLFSPRPGSRGERLTAIVRGDRVRQLLEANGWRTAGTPSSDGLPSAGVLAALREVTK
jgi:hypothetical protein